jgi:general stress protein 26
MIFLKSAASDTPKSSFQLNESDPILGFGLCSSRPMAVQNTLFNGTLWFLTRSTSEKIGEVQQDDRVTLTFAEPKESEYVSLKGRASVNQDRAKIKELWNPLYKAWFSKGPDDPEITVLRIDVSEADFGKLPGANS